MSSNQDDSILDNIEGVGLGALLLVGGLIFYLADIAAVIGLPMILMSFVVPLVMTYGARQESARQFARQRPRHNPGDGYTISSKQLRKRRT